MSKMGMLLGAGNAAIGAWGELAVGGIQADMQEASQAYSNTMRNIAANQAINDVTQNEVMAGDANRRLEVQLQQSGLQDRGNAEVSAAAAGVAGSSVTSVLQGLRRGALQAQHARMRNFQSQERAADKQRGNIQLAAIMGEDISVIQRPSAGTALLGLGVTMVDIYDSNQPEGYKTSDWQSNPMKK